MFPARARVPRGPHRAHAPRGRRATPPTNKKLPPPGKTITSTTISRVSEGPRESWAFVSKAVKRSTIGLYAASEESGRRGGAGVWGPRAGKPFLPSLIEKKKWPNRTGGRQQVPPFPPRSPRSFRIPMAPLRPGPASPEALGKIRKESFGGPIAMRFRGYGQARPGDTQDSFAMRLEETAERLKVPRFDGRSNAPVPPPAFP